jgi:hypothetical protein
MVLLALLVMFMSGWFLSSLREEARWVVIEPGLETRPDLVPFLDSLDAAGYEARWLLPDFPRVNEPATPWSVNYPARVEELSRLPLAHAVVLASNLRTGFFGPRIALPEHVRWLEVEPPGTSAEVSRIRISDDSVQVREGKSTPGATSFSSYRARGSDGRPRDTVRVIIAYDPDFETDRNTLAMVLEVVKDHSPDVLALSQVSASSYLPVRNADWTFWLSESPAPEAQGPVIVVTGTGGRNVIEQVTRSRYDLTVRLNSETVVTRNVAAHLASLLGVDPVARKKADSLDVRTVPFPLAFSREPARIYASPTATGHTASMPYLAAAILLVLLLERLIAYRRNQ